MTPIQPFSLYESIAFCSFRCDSVSSRFKFLYLFSGGCFSRFHYKVQYLFYARPLESTLVRVGAPVLLCQCLEAFRYDLNRPSMTTIPLAGINLKGGL